MRCTQDYLPKSAWRYNPRQLAPTALLRSSIPNSTVLTFLLIAGVFATAASAYDGPVCCEKAARLPENRLALDDFPWNVCSLNQTDQYPEGTVFPSVKVSLGWCKENCPGYQYSDLNQWLQPLATWIAPYIGLLLLCPIGAQRKRPPLDNSSQGEPLPAQGIWGWIKSHWVTGRAWNWINVLVTENFPEYVSLLGDPGSAICGAFAEIYADVKMLQKHQSLQEDSPRPHTHWVKRLLRKMRKIKDPKSFKSAEVEIDCTVIRLIIMVGDTDFGDKEKEPMKISTLKEKIRNDFGLSDDPKSPSTPRLSRHPSYSGKKSAAMTMATRALVDARLDFFNAVFLPVVLMLAVTASVFYDAYTKLGDNDTAHGLAFGVWYSWLLILCVAGNCFACSTNAGLTRTVLEPIISVSERRVPLRERFINWKLWEQWPDSEKGRGEHGEKDEHWTPKLSVRDWIKFLGGQFLGWLCMAIPTGCAMAISWTTPTVGLGCRSFTFLLYGVFAAVAAFLNVCCQWADQRLDWIGDRSNVERCARTTATLAYWFFTSLNALLIFIGTVLHLVGIYRTCRCKRLFATDADLVEVNSNTQIAINNAAQYWLSIGYVAFGLMWLFCGITVALRKYITVHMEEWKVDQTELIRRNSGFPAVTEEGDDVISRA